ncbi:Inner membrane protein YbiR [uncultured Eubacterium sp.]|nr:Inner membrane protein YbiR [uncultured Eubacterium sp.]
MLCKEQNLTARGEKVEAVIAIIVFLIVIVAIMTEKVHRTAVALAGAVVLMLTHILTVDKAVGYIDFNTIGVLIGMMIFVSVVKNSGIFEYIAIKAAKLAHGNPWKIMVAFMVITAVLSAFLDNVTTVLLVGPMTITIARMLKVNPVPFLMTQILASNIGGTATLIGDPPNIMIGSAAGLDFVDFIVNTGVVAVVVIVALILVMKFVYKSKLTADEGAILSVMELDENKAIEDIPLLYKSIVVMILVVVGFMFHSQLGIESATVALTAAAVMLVIGRQNVDYIIGEVEWTTILFFAGLFIVVGGLDETGVIGQLAQLVINMTKGHEIMTMMVLLWASALLSSVLDNIPFVATLIPLVLALGESGINITPLWWAISLGACLGGNGTLIGASANVVLSGISGKHGYPITFKEYTKVGFPVMIMSVVLAMIYLLIRYAV